MKRVIFAILSLCFIAPLTHAQMYRWVDSSGQIHYSSTPPQSQGAVQIKTPQQPEETTKNLAARVIAEDEKAEKEAEAKQAVYNQAAQQKAQQDENQIKLACDNMRKDLALYQNYPRARLDVDGVTRRLTPEELNTRITDLQKRINNSCQGY